MSIRLTKRLKEHLEKINSSEFLIDIGFKEEPCLQIYSPIIKELNKDDPSIKDLEMITDGDIRLFITEWFKQLFGNLKTFHLDVKGLVKKKLILKNIEPIIKNTCKID